MIKLYVNQTKKHKTKTKNKNSKQTKNTEKTKKNPTKTHPLPLNKRKKIEEYIISVQNIPITRTTKVILKL